MVSLNLTVLLSMWSRGSIHLFTHSLPHPSSASFICVFINPSIHLSFYSCCKYFFYFFIHLYLYSLIHLSNNYFSIHSSYLDWGAVILCCMDLLFKLYHLRYCKNYWWPQQRECYSQYSGCYRCYNYKNQGERNGEYRYIILDLSTGDKNDK